MAELGFKFRPSESGMYALGHCAVLEGDGKKKALQMNLCDSKRLLFSFHETLGSILHPAIAG